MDGDPRGIGGDQRAFPAILIHLFEDLFFDIQSFNDHFDGPVTICDLLEIVFKVTGSDPGGEGFIVKGSGFSFDRRRQRLINDTVTGSWLFFFFLAQVPGNNIQQQYLETNVGKVAGNTGTHYTGAQNGYFFDSSTHS